MAYGWRRARDFGGSVRLLVAGGSRGAREEPVIETADAPPAGDVLPATPARIITRTDTRVVVDVRARGSGRLVLLDTFYPGWRAEVDRRSVPIEVANGAFRAVPLGPGRHRVEFTYRPASVLAGGVAARPGDAHDQRQQRDHGHDAAG